MLVSLSDIHLNPVSIAWLEKRLGKYSGVFLPGDVADMFTPDRDKQFYLIGVWLKQLAAETGFVAFCSGNHDMSHMRPNGTPIAGWLQNIQAPNLVKDNEVQELEVQGVRLAVGCAPDNFGCLPEPFEDAVNVISELEKAQADWRVLLHHIPPGEQDASAAITKLVAESKIDLVLSGHHHLIPYGRKGSWWHKVGYPLVVNSGQPMKAPYPAYIEIEPTKTHIDLSWHTFWPRNRPGTGRAHSETIRLTREGGGNAVVLMPKPAEG